MYDNRGSIWRKWDLHVHCPTTALNNQFEGSNYDEKWDKYLDKLGEIENVSVLGITDYFSINGYKKILEFADDSRLANYELILPNCELRITPVTDTQRAINFHFIFNPEIVSDLDSLFFSKLIFEYEGEPYQCTKNDLIKLGRKYKNDPRYDEDSAYREGINQFKVGYQNISKILKESKRLRNHCLTGVSNSNNDGTSGIQHSSLAATREEIYRLSQLIFSSNPNDCKFFLGDGVDNKEEVIRKYGSLKPCIHGSDAHKLDDLCRPDGDRFTWIKSDPTFEGLRQIIFEPKYRVNIGPSIPNEPLIKINNAKISIPDDSKLDGENYCLKGNYEIQFSPFFTCLIGGRGTGKSSILNLIDHLVSEEKNKFFDEHSLTNEEDKSLKIDDLITLDDKSEKGDIEFLSQNEIEDFAQDQKRFTKAIYRRLLKLDAENEIESSAKKVKDEIVKIDGMISDFNNLITISGKIRALKKEIEKNENILASLEDEEFQENSQQLSSKSQRLNRIKRSKDTLSKVLSLVDNIQKDMPNEFDTSIPFERALSNISNSLNQISVGYDIETLNEEALEEINTLEDEIERISIGINYFLAEKGLSKENLKEASSAQTNLDLLRESVSEKEDEKLEIETRLDNQNVDNQPKENFENIIAEQIAPVNTKFQPQDETVKEIRLEYSFDEIAAKNQIVQSVQDWVKISDKELESDLRINNLENRILFEFDNHDSFLEKFNNDDTLIARDLERHFSNKYNFEIYKLIVEREFLNAGKYKQINVFYDNRPISNTSFGQRCTAAIIILLSLGNNPIIIDEPEAHLDSALIADNLVDLIKNSKVQRQIIFATHNANFVVNGDAELIHVLWIDKDDGNKMKMTSTTIEDMQNRKHLYALEGGEKAFKLREKRYNLL